MLNKRKYEQVRLGPKYEGQLIHIAEPILNPGAPLRTPSRHSSLPHCGRTAGTDWLILTETDII